MSEEASVCEGGGLVLHDDVPNPKIINYVPVLLYNDKPARLVDKRSVGSNESVSKSGSTQRNVT